MTLPYYFLVRVKPTLFCSFNIRTEMYSRPRILRGVNRFCARALNTAGKRKISAYKTAEREIREIIQAK